MVLENENNMDYPVSIQYTYDTLMALVDAIIPRTPLLAQIYGDIMLYGALDFFTDEYIYVMLNQYTVPYADLTAVNLNMAAYQYLYPDASEENMGEVRERVFFAELSPEDRFRVLSLLKEAVKNSSDFPLFQQFLGLVFIISSLDRFTMLGYYSEWFGYGTTRLDNPNQRIFQFAPPCWEQTGYPGPSFSYINYVNQYYLQRDMENGL